VQILNYSARGIPAGQRAVL